MRSEVPELGIVSSRSINRPLSVLGPSVGNCQPSVRLSVRIVVPPLMM